MKKKPTIIMLDPCSYIPFYDLNLSAGLTDQGWQVTWITSEFVFEKLSDTSRFEPDFFFFNAFPAHRLISSRFSATHDVVRGLLKTGFYPSEMARFTASIASRQPGIIHIQWANLPFIDRWFWKRWKRMGWKLVYTAHDPVPLSGTTPHPLFAVDRKLLQYADAIIVNSQRGRDELARQGIALHLIHESRLGPTLPSEMKPIDQDFAKEKLGIVKSAPTALFFGFIKPYKGLDTLLKSMPAVQGARPESCLVVAGKLFGPFTEYRCLLERLKPSPNVHWHLGFIHSRKIPLYFSAADVVVTPYRQGSSSAVIDLAHYFGRPVVATAVGGLTEQLLMARGDRCVPPDSPDRLSEAIIDVLAAACGRRKQKDLLLSTCHGNMASEWSSIASRHAEIYQKVFNG